MRVTRRDALGTTAVLAAELLASRGAHSDTPADDTCPPERLDRALADVARACAHLTTLTGPFTQERTIGLLAAKVRSSGTLTLVRPDRLRWELSPPDSVVYWMTPEGLAYKGANGQGRVPSATQRIAVALDDLRVLLGGDLGALRARYDLRGVCHGDDRISFRAVPKAGTQSSFQELRFTLAPDLVAPESVTIVEGPRDRTELRFGPLRANVPVAPGLMSPSGP